MVLQNWRDNINIQRNKHDIDIIILATFGVHNRYQCDDDVKRLDWKQIARALPSPSTSRYSRAVTTTAKANLNVYNALARLAYLVSQSDWRFGPVFHASLSVFVYTRNLLVK